MLIDFFSDFLATFTDFLPGAGTDLLERRDFLICSCLPGLYSSCATPSILNFPPRPKTLLLLPKLSSSILANSFRLIPCHCGRSPPLDLRSMSAMRESRAASVLGSAAGSVQGFMGVSWSIEGAKPPPNRFWW